MTRIKHEDVEAYIGAKIKGIRIARGISQSALADKLGVTFQQIQKYESGKNRVSVSALLVIAGALQVSFAEFLPDQDGATVEPLEEIDPATMATAHKLAGCLGKIDNKVARPIVSLVKALARVEEDADIAA